MQRKILILIDLPGFIKTAMTDKLDDKFKEAIISKFLQHVLVIQMTLQMQYFFCVLINLII